MSNDNELDYRDLKPTNDELEELVRRRLGIQRSLVFKMPQVRERWDKIDQETKAEPLTRDRLIKRKINAAVVIFGINRTTGNAYRTSFEGHPIYQDLMLLQKALIQGSGDDVAETRQDQASSIPAPSSGANADLKLGNVVRQYLGDFLLTNHQMSQQPERVQQFVGIISTLIAKEVKNRPIGTDYSELLMKFCKVTETLFPGESEETYCNFVDMLVLLAKGVIQDPAVQMGN